MDFEKIKKEAKSVAGIAVLATAFSATSGTLGKAYGQDKKGDDQKQGQVEKDAEKKINETKLTESSKWSIDIVKSVRDGIKQAKSEQDANKLTQQFARFNGEYFMPTKGKLKEGAYGTTAREYSHEDLEFLLQQAQSMTRMLYDLHAKFSLAAYDNLSGELKNIISNLHYRLDELGQ